MHKRFISIVLSFMLVTGTFLQFHSHDHCTHSHITHACLAFLTDEASGHHCDNPSHTNPCSNDSHEDNCGLHPLECVFDQYHHILSASLALSLDNLTVADLPIQPVSIQDITVTVSELESDTPRCATILYIPSETPVRGSPRCVA